MKSIEKPNTKRRLKKFLIIAAAVLLIILCVAGFMFRNELAIISSIKKVDNAVVNCVRAKHLDRQLLL